MTFLTRVLPPLMALSVAGLAFLLSFAAMRDVSATVGAVDPSLAWAVPLVVDGALVSATAIAWAAGLRARRDWPAIAATVAFVALSVALNVAHAAPSQLARLIAAVPPVALLVTLELALRALRYSSVDTSPDVTNPPIGTRMDTLTDTSIDMPTGALVAAPVGSDGHPPPAPAPVDTPGGDHRHPPTPRMDTSTNTPRRRRTKRPRKRNRRWTDADKARGLAALDAHDSATAAANASGIPRATLARWARDHDKSAAATNGQGGVS